MDGINFFYQGSGIKMLQKMGLRDQNNGKKIGIDGSRIYHDTTLLLKYWAEHWLTTRAKRNIMKPTDERATSWSCHFKKRYHGDPLLSKTYSETRLLKFSY